MKLQKDHESIKNSRHKLSITVIAENIRTPENLGLILRVSEAFGVRKIYFVGTLGVDFTTKAKRAARNTHTLNNFEFIPDVKDLLSELKPLNATIVALEITENSEAIHKVSFDHQKPLVLVIGSEREGISEPLLALTDQAVHIQMFGQNSSLNVTHALAIALHQVVLYHS